MNDMVPPANEAGLLAEARVQLQADADDGCVGVQSLERIVGLLESLPPAAVADERVRLVCLFMDLMPQNSWISANHAKLARLLRSAWTDELIPLDARLARRWYSSTAATDIFLGRSAEAAHCLAKAIVLADRLDAPAAMAATLVNLALLASGAGAYEEALQLLNSAEHQVGKCGPDIPRIKIAALLNQVSHNRAIALFRLRRLSAALAEYSRAYQVSLVAPDVRGNTEAAAAIIEIQIESGDVVYAEALYEARRRFFLEKSTEDRWGELAFERVGALLRIARGDTARGFADLQAVVDEALTLSPDGSADDIVIESLHTLELAYRLTGQADEAREVIRRIGTRLRANAERTLVALSLEPGLPIRRGVDGALRELDVYIAGRASAVGAGEHAVVATLQQLIALGAQGSLIEDPSGEHGVRVAAMCRLVSVSIGLDPHTSQMATIAGLAHDAGKFGIPRSVLCATETLREDDQALYEAHSDNGASLIERAAVPDRARLAEIVRLHHHPYDGVGASRPLRGDDIPIEARIVAACDSFDALVMGRPRRPAVSVGDALRELLRMSGRELDPTVTAVVVDVVRKLQRQHLDLMTFLAADADQYDFTAGRRLLRKAAAA